MKTFTASNGVHVEYIEHGDQIGMTERRVAGNPSEYKEWTGGRFSQALREFFRAEEDERLGIWRWPEDPSIIVYPNEKYRSVHVAKEGTPKSVYWAEAEMISVIDSDAPFPRAARAYFDAHPEPDPWRAAQEGEVWIVTVMGNQYPAIFQAGAFRDHGGMWLPDDITDARRIYPEEAPGE